MPPRSPEKLRKVTLNLFDKDCAAMERYYGHGWSEQVRDLVNKHMKTYRQATDTFSEIRSYGDPLAGLEDQDAE